MNTTTELRQTSRIQGPAGLLYIETSGSGGMPVMFAHSFGGNVGHWKYQREHLEGERRVVAFDFREHGKSEPPADKNFSTAALAEDIAAVAHSQKLQRFVLVGHSFGGSAAIVYAKNYPDRVAGLVLAGTPGKHQRIKRPRLWGH
jgi:pimeloyl-ACP methyl ester carboxylesterase